MNNKEPNMITPVVIEGEGRNERVYDIFSRLMKNGIIFLGEPITNAVANIVVGQLLFLNEERPKNDIMFYINSPGGSITAGTAILDTMNFVNCDIRTIVIGQAASMAAVILANGTKGKRYSLPNSSVLIHQPWGGTEGQASDIEIYAANIVKTKARLNKFLAEKTGQSLKKIVADTDRDNIMDADEAKAYGLIDKIITKKMKATDDDDDD
jgi:ATP-dependent Clp protease protease subunit